MVVTTVLMLPAFSDSTASFEPIAVVASIMLRMVSSMRTNEVRP